MGKISKLQRSKKHKKIKAIDPFYKGPRPADRKAASRDQGPGKYDVDDAPASSRGFHKVKQNTSKPSSRKNKFWKRHKEDIIGDEMSQKAEKGMTRPLKHVPVFKQRKGESEKVFLNRMERETQNVIHKAQFEDKFDVDVEETKSGELKYEKRKLGEGVPSEEEESATKKKKKNQKKQEKLKKVKEKKLHDQIDNFEEFHDEVRFGEVVLAPPVLTAKPRQMKVSKTNHPGTKSLLLTNMMSVKTGQPSAHAPRSKTSQSSTHEPRAKGKSLKRKHMSVADRRIMDGERDKAIEMYRKIKKHKTKD